MGKCCVYAWDYRKSKPVTMAGEERIMVTGDGRLQTARAGFGTITGAICYDLDYPDLVR